MCFRRVAFLFFCCTLIIGSSGSSAVASGSRQLNWVETKLSRLDMSVGQTTQIRCQAFDEHDRILPATFSYVIRPSKGWTRKGAQLTMLRTGSWEITCVAKWQGQSRSTPTPASLQVKAASPHTLSASIPNLPTWLPQGQAIKIRTKVTDVSGFSIVGMPLTYTVKPKEGVDRSEAPILRFTKSGEYKITIAPASKKLAGVEGLRRTLRVRVDVDAPQLRLDTPVRAAMLSGRPDILVKGHVRDLGSGVAFVRVNGKPVQVDAKGVFQTSVSARWGLNFLSVEARDKAGQSTLCRQSFFYSNAYQTFSQKGALGTVQRAFSVNINRSFLDDGDRSVLRDLASLLEFSLNQVKLDTFAPTQLVKGSYKIPPFGPTLQYEVKKRGPFQLGRRSLKIRPFKGRLWLWTELRDLKLPLEIKVGSVKIKPLITAPKLSLSMWIHLGLENDDVKVTIQKVFGDFRSIRLQGLTGMMGWIQGFLQNQLRARIRKMMVVLLERRLGPLLKQALKKAKFDKTWTLPAFLGKQRARLVSSFQRIQLRKEGIRLKLAVGLSFSKRMKRVTVGAIKAPKKGYLWPKSSFAMGLSADLLNQIFFAVWSSGLLKQNITPLLQKELAKVKDVPFPLPKPEVTFSAGLPPVLMYGNASYPIAIGIGDFLLSVKLPHADGVPFVLQTYTSVLLGCRLVQKGKQIVFELAPKPLAFQLHVKKIQGSSKIIPAHLSTFVEQMVKQVIPSTFTSMLPKLHIPQLSLPQFEKKAIVQAFKDAQRPSKKAPVVKPKVLRQLVEASERTLKALRKVYVKPVGLVFDGSRFLLSFQVKKKTVR